MELLNLINQKILKILLRGQGGIHKGIHIHWRPSPGPSDMHSKSETAPDKELQQENSQPRFHLNGSLTEAK